MIPARILEISITGSCTEAEARELATMALVGRSRRRDPLTSVEAAESLKPHRLTANRTAVLDALRAIGRAATDEELVAYYGGRRNDNGWPAQSPSGLRSRRSELVASGMVEPAGHGITMAGNRATLWRATATTL